MGQGILGIDRPFAPGDEGWFGVTRPLVGAANAIKAEVTTKSAVSVAVANSTPESITQLREEINAVNRELDNKRAKLERFEQASQFELVQARDGLTLEALERKREALFEEINMLQRTKDDLVNELSEKRNAIDEGQLRPKEIKDGIKQPVSERLKPIGMSKGPFIDVQGETTTIVFSKVDIRESDIAQTEQVLDELGFLVSEVEAIEFGSLIG